MQEHRRHNRVDSDEKCILNFSGWYYQATVKNISSGGALLHPNDPLPELHVGDDCNVNMKRKSLRDHPCKVARVETSHVALKFTGGRIKIK